MNSQINEIEAYERSLVFPEGATTIAYGARGLNYRGRLRYRLMVLRESMRFRKFYRLAIEKGACYYGPFKGEFGHFLLHNLPFLVHLHRRGVKIHYCGMDLHRPFLVDENGESIIHKWFPLRDFFAESRPICNQTVVPADVELEIAKFQREAAEANLPYLDISRETFYWFIFRNLQLQGLQEKYNLGKVYGKGKNNSCVIFPRKKGGEFTPNNGGPWDYAAIAKTVAPFFDKVYLVGHPSLSAEVAIEGNIELKVSANNADTLRYCAEADLIITQHSGAVHLGAYVNTSVLVIFKGHPPIKGLIDTLRFRRNIAEKPLNYAFSLKEIENFVASGKY